MRTRCVSIVLVFAALMLLQGCWVYSAYPLAEGDSDLVFDRALLGTWVQDEGCVLNVARLGDENSYRVSYAVPRQTKGDGCLLKAGQSASFMASVVELNGVRFLDLYPADREPMHHTMNLHSFYKFTIEGRTLTLMPMNGEWLKEHIAAGDVSLAAHQQNGEKDDDLILTSSTHDLRSFLVSNATSEQLFAAAQKIVLQRKLQPPQPPR